MQSEMSTVNNTVDKFGRNKRVSGNKLLALRGLPGVGFKLTKDNHYDIENKRLKNLGEPIDDHDGVTSNYVNNRLQTYHENIHKAMNETTDLIIREIKEYVNMKFVKSAEENHTIYNKRINEMLEKVKMEMWKYEDKLNAEVKRLAINNHNSLMANARIAKLEHIVAELQTKKVESGGLAFPPELMPEVDI